MNKEIIFPLPIVHPAAAKEYWDGCRRHELRLERCCDCGTYRFPPRAACHNCGSLNAEWAKVTGRGKVYSCCVAVEPVHPALRDKPPYSIALVDLEEGARMMTNIVDCDPHDVKIDMPVEVVFEDLTDEISLPKFRPSH